MKPTTEEARGLATAHRNFVESMRRLTPRQASARAAVLAGGIKPADPYTRALAQQFVDAEAARDEISRLNNDIAAVEAEIGQGGHRPRDPHWRGAALERKRKLEEQLAAQAARVINISEDTLDSAKSKAVVELRETRAQEAKAAAIMAAVERQAAEAELADVEARAAEIVRGRRASAGKKPNNDAD